jgi:hypothetical protein
VKLRRAASRQPLAIAFFALTAPPLCFAQGPAAASPASDRPLQGDDRPGLFRLGPVYLTPSLRIGNVGFDTNVLYTSTDRRADVAGSAGPGLDVVLPVTRRLRATGTGFLDYHYFVRSEELRKLTRGGGGRVEWIGSKVSVGVGRLYVETYGRPNIEVDRRITQGGWQSFADLRLHGIGARLGIATSFDARRHEPAAGQEFVGADLRRALARDEYRAKLELSYSLTPKTSFVVGGDHQWDRFLEDTTRDADSNRAYAGFQIQSETRLSGRAVAGARSFRPLHASRVFEARAPYAEADVRYTFGPRTRLSATYQTDLAYSAFDPRGGTPTFRHEVATVRLEKDLLRRLNLRLFASQTRAHSDGAITVLRREGDRIVAERRDTLREGGADLGFLFRPELRVGFAAVYTERRSTIADLGLEGLLLGMTVTYTPPTSGLLRR